MALGGHMSQGWALIWIQRGYVEAAARTVSLKKRVDYCPGNKQWHEVINTELSQPSPSQDMDNREWEAEMEERLISSRHKSVKHLWRVRNALTKALVLLLSAGLEIRLQGASSAVQLPGGLFIGT